MSFRSVIKNPFGYQVFITTPVIGNIPSAQVTTVYSVTPAAGLWIVNVNNIETNATDNALSGAVITNFFQSISYNGVIRERTNLIGADFISIALSCIAIIETDGSTPVIINIYAETSDGSVYDIDTGKITLTRLY